MAVTAAVLLVGSLIPLPARTNPDSGPHGPDKGLHLVGHAALAVAVVAAVGDEEPRVRTAVAAVAVSTLFGVATESLQEWVPGRTFERGDVFAGFVGSVLGAIPWRRLTAGSDVLPAPRRRPSRRRRSGGEATVAP